ncbi:hypothetical protein JAAARDRAFT_40382 [Jaapia argillacea MUCL 33604]|uniref:Uncharacterized protein n=1 Tax=Jaapia argillacea MUCL 33604 TaxID=933084 RepID=A0A067PM55_9AGAM|nr:hypothetical protein JAAARDRAFT_40382 [Jaapia argillacea MUCL 33604]
MTVLLPIATIQPSFSSVIDDVHEGLIPAEDFWISCYKFGDTSVHGKVKVSASEGNRSEVRLDARDGVEIEKLGGGSYTVACPALAIPHTKIALPRQVFSDSESSERRIPRKITAFDVSPDGTRFATGFDDGSVHLTPIISRSQSQAHGSSGSGQPAAKIHLTTVSDLRFFPSSRVLLSAGEDFALSILPADLLHDSSTPPPNFSPVRTLKGHKRAITRTAIISRGRNVLSCAKDGTVRLWDVGGGQQIRSMWVQRYTPVMSMSLGERRETLFSGPVHEESVNGNGVSTGLPIDSREVDTEDKLVFCALQNGEFEAFDLGTKHSVYLSSSSSPDHVGQKLPALTSIAYSPTHHLLATGSLHGLVTVYDTRNFASPLTSFKRNASSIENLALTVPSTWLGSSAPLLGEIGLVIGTEDGLPYVAGIHPEGPGVVAELVGVDCDAVRIVRVRGEGEADIWTAADDGVVRRY